MSDIPELQEYANLCFAGSQQQTNSLLDDRNLATAIKKMVEVQLAVMMIPTVKRIVESFLGSLEPMMENLVRKTDLTSGMDIGLVRGCANLLNVEPLFPPKQSIRLCASLSAFVSKVENGIDICFPGSPYVSFKVKEEIELAQERFSTREKWKPHDDPHISQVRCLELQFWDKISVPVYTGKQIKGERGDSIRLALVDSDGNLVNSGPEASAKVEILVVQEGACDGDNTYICGDSEGVIGEKKGRKPLLSRNYFKMKEGIVDLDNIKFKNESKWTKTCEVNLVARVVENLNGTDVKDAKTESFRVVDCRSTLYKKHDTPKLSDEVWRLERICRGGRLHKRLQEAKIYSVKDFLKSLNLDCQNLQERLDVGAEKFKVIVDHAQRCMIGRERYMYCTPGCDKNVPVVFDVVGHLRGLLREQSFVPMDNLTEDEKREAQKVVVSAFEHWKDVRSFDNESSLADIPSQLSHGVNTPISSRIVSPSSSNGRALSHTLSQHMSPIYSFGSTSCFDGYASLLQMDNMDFISNYSEFSRTIRPDLGDYRQFLVFNHDDCLQFENLDVESCADQSTAGVSCQRNDDDVPSSSRAPLRWRMAVVSVRKRIMAPENTHAQKKQRHS